jgi:hypothetical protein
MNTTTSHWTRRVARGAVLAAATTSIALGVPAVGHADPGPMPGPGMGCETIHWGPLGMQRRKICDGPQQADGTWQRTRTIYSPALYLGSPCLSSPNTSGDGDDTMVGSMVDCSPHAYPENTLSQESYPVAPNTVLPDEPGWLPPFTNNIL